MTDREKLIELIAEGNFIDTSVGGNKYSITFDLNLLADHLIANGIEKVVYCDDCVNHGHCIPEDTFRLVRMQHPFCAAGKAKEGDNA